MVKNGKNSGQSYCDVAHMFSSYDQSIIMFSGGSCVSLTQVYLPQTDRISYDMSHKIAFYSLWPKASSHQRVLIFLLFPSVIPFSNLSVRS